jgi:hypothetical protein
MNTDALSQETSQQKPILNHPASGKMTNWKNSFLQSLGKFQQTATKAQPINPENTSKTMAGSVNPGTPGGPKEVRAAQAANGQMAQNTIPQRQPVANPAAGTHNSGMTVSASHNPPKEASMTKINPNRIATVRALLKFAACLSKGKKKKPGMTPWGKKAEAGIATLSSLAAAIGARKVPGGATQALTRLPLRALGGAGGGAVLGAIGGGAQKHKRLKAQGKTRKQLKEKGEKKAPREKKEAQLRLVFQRKKASLMRKVAIGVPPAAAKWGWKGIAALLGIPLATAGITAAAPPLFRAGRHELEYSLNPMYKQQYDFQKMMSSPQMMMMNMMRGQGGYGGGMAIPPIMNPEDRQMLQHATYLRGLRSRTRAMQEAFE